MNRIAAQTLAQQAATLTLQADAAQELGEELLKVAAEYEQQVKHFSNRAAHCKSDKGIEKNENLAAAAYTQQISTEREAEQHIARADRLHTEADTLATQGLALITPAAPQDAPTAAEDTSGITFHSDATTAAELTARAAAQDQEAADSFERSDTDGFMSQWAHGVMAGKDLLQAEIEENGGTCSLPALFDLDGNLIAAKRIETQYGMAWGILASDDPRSRITGWFHASQARDDDAYVRNNAKKGYYIGRVMAPAVAKLGGGNAACVMAYAERTDGGFSRDVAIVDNGQPPITPLQALTAALDALEESEGPLDASAAPETLTAPEGDRTHLVEVDGRDVGAVYPADGGWGAMYWIPQPIETAHAAADDAVHCEWAFMTRESAEGWIHDKVALQAFRAASWSTEAEAPAAPGKAPAKPETLPLVVLFDGRDPQTFDVTGTRHAYYLLRKLAGQRGFDSAKLTAPLAGGPDNVLRFDRDDILGGDRSGTYGSLLDRANTHYDLTK